ncbi:hypothetical protein, partial [Rhizorhabdus sp.]|uniref:hypothetical protein n=1 Tax=Rhizorhabdus sp. TaxID=1968843 RepID=UPI0035B0DCAF
MASRPISYEQQVSPGGGARMGFASDEAFGAGLGRDIAAAGGSVVNAAQRREDERDTLDWNARAAELRGWSDQTADQLRSTSGPGGAGHVDAVLKAYDEQVGPMLAAISNPRVKREAEADVRASRASLAAREDIWARGQSIGKAFTDLGDQVDAAANRLSTNPSAAALGEELDAFDLSIERLTGPADAKVEFAKKQRERMAIAYAEALDPKVRKQILDKGGLNDFLSPEKLTSLKSGADVDIRTMDAQARTLANLGKAEARDQVDSVIRMASDGVPLPDADLEKTQQLAAQWGFDAKVYNVAALRVQNNLNRETKAWTPQQFSSQINALEQKISAAGDNAETADVLARDHLVTLRDKRL